MNSSKAPQVLMISALSVGVLGLLAGGFAVGTLMRPAVKTAAVTSKTTPSKIPAATAQTTSGDTGITTYAGSAKLWTSPVKTLAGKTTTLAHGSHGTAVIMMGSWCLFCAYEDEYVIPELVKQDPQITLDIVDVSPQGGIGVPGPESPAFSGHDGTGSAINTVGMERVMTQYAKTFHLPSSAHVYVAPSATRTAWDVSAYPTWVFANGTGLVTKIAPGALTTTTASTTVQAAVSS